MICLPIPLLDEALERYRYNYIHNVVWNVLLTFVDITCFMYTLKSKSNVFGKIIFIYNILY